MLGRQGRLTGCEHFPSSGVLRPSDPAKPSRKGKTTRGEPSLRVSRSANYGFLTNHSAPVAFAPRPCSASKNICCVVSLQSSRMQLRSRRMHARPKLSKLELRILEALWTCGKASIRDIHGLFPEPRPAYTTVQTIVYRMEAKRAVRRVEKHVNADIFEPLVAQDVARNRLLDEILSFFGGKAAPLMAQLADAGKLTPDDVQEVERTIRRLKARRKEESK